MLDTGVDVHTRLKKRNSDEEVSAFIPFSNKDKIKITVRVNSEAAVNNEDPELYVVVQGTPEMLHHYCSKIYLEDSNDSNDDFSTSDKKASLRRVDEMAKEGLVPVSYGYKKITLSELEETMESIDAESLEFKENLLDEL